MPSGGDGRPGHQLDIRPGPEPAPPRGADELKPDSLDLAAPVLGTPDLLTTVADQLDHLLQAQNDAWRAEFGAGLAGIIRMLRKGRSPDEKKKAHACFDQLEAAGHDLASFTKAELARKAGTSKDTVRRVLAERSTDRA
jgi:hypothetical protein